MKKYNSSLNYPASFFYNEMSTNITRWGIIGCGNVTELKSGPAYQKTAGFELVAVMRRDADKAKDYAQRHGVKKYYSNADELINDPEVDAVYIATPPDSHKYYALKVADAGKPCCIEKPLATNYRDSLLIYQTFKDKNIHLFVAYYRRSLPRFIQVKTWLEDNCIGQIRHINWHLTKPANEIDLSQRYNWRTDPAIASAGYFDDLASHGLDLICYLLGNIKQAVGISVNQQHLYDAKDAVSASWLHENGITGSGSWNFGCSHREDRVEIFASEGKIEFSVFAEKPLIISNQQGTREVFIKNPENIQLYHVENMRRQLHQHFSEQTSHPSNGLTATHTSWVMDQILGLGGY